MGLIHKHFQTGFLDIDTCGSKEILCHSNPTGDILDYINLKILPPALFPVRKIYLDTINLDGYKYVLQKGLWHKVTQKGELLNSEVESVTGQAETGISQGFIERC